MTREGRFIDLVVRSPNGILGIENKPWAKHQRGQLAAYVQCLRRSGSCWGLAYIAEFPSAVPEDTFDGENPEQLSTSGNYFTLSYAIEIAEWLKRCGQLCEADRVRWFLRDLADYVAERFRGGEVRLGNVK